MKIYVDIESVREVLADVKDCEDKQYALALLEWAVDKRTISEEAIRADERTKVLDEALKAVESAEMWLYAAIHEDRGNYSYNIDMAFDCLKKGLKNLKEQE